MGQVVSVPVVPNGVAGANGVTWRKSCYNAVHCGILQRIVQLKSLVSCCRHGTGHWKASQPHSRKGEAEASSRCGLLKG